VLPQYIGEEANAGVVDFAQPLTQPLQHLPQINYVECSELLSAARESFDAIVNANVTDVSFKTRFRMRMMRSFLLTKLNAYILEHSAERPLSVSEVADRAIELMQRYSFPGI